MYCVILDLGSTKKYIRITREEADTLVKFSTLLDSSEIWRIKESIKSGNELPITVKLGWLWISEKEGEVFEEYVE